MLSALLDLFRSAIELFRSSPTEAAANQAAPANSRAASTPRRTRPPETAAGRTDMEHAPPGVFAQAYVETMEFERRADGHPGRSFVI